MLMVGVDVFIVSGVVFVSVVVDMIGGERNSTVLSVLDDNWEKGVSSMMVISGVGCLSVEVSSMIVLSCWLLVVSSIFCCVVFSVSGG